MKCPYCQDEMEKGYINNAGSSLIWFPMNEKPGIFKFSKPSKNGVLLSKLKFTTSAKALSYYCRTCHKIIIDTMESDTLNK